MTALAAVLLLAVLPAPATPPRAVPTLRAVRTSEAIRLDGRLDEAVWSEAAAFDAFRQSDPTEGAPGSERTEVRVVYDDGALYVGLRLHDREPKRIVRRLARRDEGADADRVTVYLDPHHDRQTGAQFEVSAANVQGDAAIFNDSWTDSSWDGVWESAVALDDEGWSVEMRLPFSQLRFAPAESHVFGINVSRTIPRKNETQWLELVPKTESGLASRMADLAGLDGLHPPRALSLLPYTVGRAEAIAPDGPGDPWNDGTAARSSFGFDAKYGLSSNLTVDLTANPDFGQVEVDPAVVNLSEFETFFDEKRPFFLEGAQIFNNFGQTGSNSFWGFNRSEPNLFYSRRIGRAPQGESDGDFVDRPDATTILGAVKLSGKTRSGWSLAGLQAVTARESARIQTAGLRSGLLVEPATSYSALRAQRTFGRSALGFLATGVAREAGTPALADRLVSHAFVLGVDGHVFLDGKKDWVVTGRLAASRIDGSTEAIRRAQESPLRYFQRPGANHVHVDPTRTSLSGYTGSVNLNRNSGALQLNAALWGTSPGFDSDDLGFTGRADRGGGHAVLTWRQTKPHGFTRERRAWISKWYALNFSGARQGDGLNGSASVQLRNYWWINVNGFHDWRTQNDGLTRGGPPSVHPSVNGGGVSLETNGRKAAGFDSGFFYAHDAHGGWSLEGSGNVWLRPFSRLSIRLGPRFNRDHTPAQYVDTFDDALAVATAGRRYVFGDLHQTQVSLVGRVNCLLSPRMSLQIYFQPLLSAGDYADFKELAMPGTFDFLHYGTAIPAPSSPGVSMPPTSSPPVPSLFLDADRYTADPDGLGPAPSFGFDNPNFNFKSLRVNAVYRWEWRPGTTLFLAWTQVRDDDKGPGVLRFGRDLRGMLRAGADDVFLIKVAYRFGR
jgi:hypothetical protein